MLDSHTYSGFSRVPYNVCHSPSSQFQYALGSSPNFSGQRKEEPCPTSVPNTQPILLLAEFNQQHSGDGSAIPDYHNNPSWHVHSPPLYPASSLALDPLLLQNGDDGMVRNDDKKDIQSAHRNPCCAELVYRALMDAPGHRLSVQDIYKWIRENTSLGKDPSYKGWQCSIRHNLSMNDVRTMIPQYCKAATNKQATGLREDSIFRYWQTS